MADRPRVVICDVAPRDGLQNDATILTPGVRARLVQRLSAAGVPRVEVVSFVHPARVPAMAGAEEVVALTDGVACERAGLVLNERGFERLCTTTLKRVNIGVAATETFGRRNQNAGIEEAVSTACAIRDRAVTRGIVVTSYVMVAFGCPFEGAVDPGFVVDLATRLAGGGASEIVVADTIGIASPRQVGRMVAAVTEALGKPIGVHLHNTRNAGYANAYAALEAGASLLDASLGGVGGCPFAPGATGNIATEDLVGMLERDGCETGIDLDRLVASARELEGLVGHRLEGALYRLDEGVQL
jgi:isopropylmalate/homocitrate/citramalate synthase